MRQVLPFISHISLSGMGMSGIGSSSKVSHVFFREFFTILRKVGLYPQSICLSVCLSIFEVCMP